MVVVVEEDRLDLAGGYPAGRWEVWRVPRSWTTNWKMYGEIPRLGRGASMWEGSLRGADCRQP